SFNESFFSLRAQTISPILSIISWLYSLILIISSSNGCCCCFFIPIVSLKNFIRERPAPRSSCISVAILVLSFSIAFSFSSSRNCFFNFSFEYHFKNNQPQSNTKARIIALKKLVCQKDFAISISNDLLYWLILPWLS